MTAPSSCEEGDSSEYATPPRSRPRRAHSVEPRLGVKRSPEELRLLATEAAAVARSDRARRSAAAREAAAERGQRAAESRSRRNGGGYESAVSPGSAEGGERVGGGAGASRRSVCGWHKPLKLWRRGISPGGSKGASKGVPFAPIGATNAIGETSGGSSGSGSRGNTSNDRGRCGARWRSSRRFSERGSSDGGHKRHSCREFTCRRRAHFGTPGWVPAHCVEHRRDWEVFLKVRCILLPACFLP